MPTSTMDDVISKAEMIEIEPTTGVAIKGETRKEEKGLNATDHNGEKSAEEPKTETAEEEMRNTGKQPIDGDVPKEEEKKDEKGEFETEPKTGVSFPVKLDDGKQLNAVGIRKKSMLGIGIKIYGFGLYADNARLKEILESKFGKAPTKPTEEMYQLVIDSDAGMRVRLVIVFSNLTMSRVKKNFDEGLGASIKRLTGGKNDELAKKVMGEASDDIKLTSGSVVEISRLPGYILQTKVMGEVVSKVESELLCRAFINMYLGDDPFDKEAKDRFGMSLITLF
ncbi:hypothetical protein RHSIM_Rhsim10G0016600 [Rhododendron simsii]|uniref:Chalcone isomerase domain-containing protein n=1 Tax=Rhododendron simsii TaxID=118357 RepID=A0A834LD58_RHOSS|nr:hypothetical protein RHSIM_Rhsim10G0016600 [Rhododendron simsii]